MCVLGRAYALMAHTSRMGAAIGKADTPRGNHVQRRSTERLYLGAPMPAAYGARVIPPTGGTYRRR